MTRHAGSTPARAFSGWATGYDLITRKVFVCPVHGEVSNSRLALCPTGWYHVGCGLVTQRRRILGGMRAT